ncbi:phosphoribosylamine--glycine ligase [Lentibacillus amyloliquefaciens]|uniref:Phosphoribosylamine--glycine ligase n=1 Tax=Lentibacillus amyloliquefaciens TaxID=1472767 RepID=A0A0U4G8J1_9BACI|nr:phosphoribosylamine--glycine ligase [Lentibacillus amyloliquefaciens]ALX49050.1 phosphoribosylamine--glycine ligase [Lentibacillus amyloliquefaciens]
MNLFVIGQGGREHSMIMKLAESEKVDRIYAAPGNGGISDAAECVDIDELDIDGLIDFAGKKQIDLTIVGPENPLLAGIADRFHEAGLAVFAPGKDAALIEGSKQYAKVFMEENGIPTAAYASFTDAAEAKFYIEKQGAPIVVKADGLAAGKGVIVARTVQEAISAVDDILVNKAFSEAGKSVVIEECLNGEEFSLMAFVHGTNVFPMLPARDHKRAYDDDLGPNTGGMGAYAPAKDISSETLAFAAENVLQKAADGLAGAGRPFTGILYAGMIMTNDGPKVIEFNARFGDPETQIVLPLLKNDLLQVILDVLEGKDPALQWEDKSCAGVVLASKGYPGSYKKGVALPEINSDGDTFVIHAGTRKTDKGIVSDGGRVLFAGAKGKDVADASEATYKWLAQHVHTEDFFYRTDIGQ